MIYFKVKLFVTALAAAHSTASVKTHVHLVTVPVMQEDNN